MKLGDLVKVTEQRGAGSYYNETDLGTGVVVDIKKTSDLFFETVGPINLGDNVTVMLETGEVRTFVERSVEVIS